MISIAVMGSLAIGAADYAAGNRLGLGKEFEQGIMACGRLILCMAGFMVLAPLIAQKLGAVVSPLLRNVGMDPSILAGMLLANDAGGAALAMELAESEAAGLYSGLIVGSMLGTTVMLNIPTVMSFASREEHSAVIYGMLCGIITIPLGCLTGGLIAGFPVDMILINTVPVLMLSLFLLIFVDWKSFDLHGGVWPGLRGHGEADWSHPFSRYGYLRSCVSSGRQYFSVFRRSIHFSSYYKTAFSNTDWAGRQAAEN